MKKAIGIIILGLLICNNSFADANEIKKMMKKSESYNLGIKKGDTTINGLKLKPLMNKEAYKNAVKNNYGWLDYGFNIVYAKDGEPVRWSDTAQRFELHISRSFNRSLLWKKVIELLLLGTLYILFNVWDFLKH